MSFILGTMSQLRACLLAGPKGDTQLPLLNLVDADGGFPAWTVKSRGGALSLRLLFPKTSCVQFLHEHLDAALITGVSFPTGIQPTHVILGTTLPVAHVVAEGSYFSEYKKAHGMVAAVTESSAATDKLYGFQAVKGQLIQPAESTERMFKSAPCFRVAISIPLHRFEKREICSQWEASEKKLRAELDTLPPGKQAAFAVAWLWLESRIKAEVSQKQ